MKKQRLGQILLAKDWVDRTQLTAALRLQQQVGGRLGTCLLDQGALAEDRLLAGLSLQAGVPDAGGRDLREVEGDVLRLIPADLARRHRAVPFRLLGGRLSIAMADPGDINAQTDLGFASGKRLVIHVTSEVRLAEALDRYYGEASSSRVRTLLERLNREPAAAIGPDSAERSRPRSAQAGRSASSEIGGDDSGGRQEEFLSPLPPLDTLLPGELSTPAAPASRRKAPAGPQPSASPRSPAPQSERPVAPQPPASSGPATSSAAPPRRPPASQAPPAARGKAAPGIAAPPPMAQAPTKTSPVRFSGLPEVPLEPPPPPIEPPPGDNPWALGEIGLPVDPDEETRDLTHSGLPVPASIHRARQKKVAGRSEATVVPLDALQKVRRRLGGARNRDEVGAILLDELASRFHRAALFYVQGDQVRGWMARGAGLNPKRFGELTISLGEPSAFLNLRAGAPVHLGPLAPMPPHQVLASVWGERLGRSVILLPVRLRGRLVVVLYGEWHQGAAPAAELRDLQTLPALAEASLERCIVLKKQRKDGTAVS